MHRFTIRVYGLLIHDGKVLVADEIIRKQHITKFPGGGLEYGEGTKECLAREIREEIGIEALSPEHFYTTDFFQRSSFHADEMQVMSIYYTFRVKAPASVMVRERPFDFSNTAEGAEVFRWLDLSTAKEEDVSLPIDRVVLRMLLGQQR